MKAKTIAGLIIVILSLAGMAWWELSAREMLMTEEVLAAAEDIKAGTVIETRQLTGLRMDKDSISAGALSPGQAALCEGWVASVDIPAGSPLFAALFREKNEVLKGGASIFTLPKEWIALRPAMLRAGDRVKLISLPEQACLGSFEIAFIRDSGEQAINGDEAAGADVLQRNSAGGVISSVEIICREEEYLAIYERSLGLPKPGPEESEEAAEEGGRRYPDPYAYGYIDEKEEEREPFLLLIPEV